MQIFTACHAWYCAQIATAALLFKKTELALSYYEKILTRQPAHGLTLSRIAFLHAQTGHHALAINGMERVLAINGEDADSWFNLGFLHQQTSDHAAAINAFERCTQINERHDRAWYGWALSLIALGHTAEALAPLQKNIQLQPMSPYGHMTLARTYFTLGERDRCEQQMRALMEFDPKNAALIEDETGLTVGVDRWWHR